MAPQAAKGGFGSDLLTHRTIPKDIQVQVDYGPFPGFLSSLWRSVKVIGLKI
jgi:hypothetical protein